ncbi:peptidyl-prolyl cis-trans isomerase [Roseibium sp.]|uniref:peptidylprolyl isomerase n=1 Tax=Roseibium sp. TaxID=1936156 RepID=UPI003A977966
MPRLRTILREPLVHFLVLGALIFGYYAIASPASDTGDATANGRAKIVISDQTALRLESEFMAIWQRPPSTEEKHKLIDNYVREEILVREAVRLGLDQDDAVLRRRLVQKLEFLNNSAARAVSPKDEDLRAHYDANHDTYMRSGRIAFEQIFLGEKPDAERLADIRVALGNGVAAETLGERTLLPFSVMLAAEERVAGIFGRTLFDQLIDLPPERWHGPLKSGFGYHLIRIVDYQPRKLLAFENVRALVTEDWVLARAQQLRSQRYDALRKQYRIILPESAR